MTLIIIHNIGQLYDNEPALALADANADGGSDEISVSTEGAALTVSPTLS